MHSVAVTNIEETLFQESARTVTNHAITFHLTESQTTIARSTFSRLSRQNLGGTSRPGVNLVADHMLESLVICGTEENHNFELLSGETIIHGLVTVALVTQLVELRAHEINRLVLKWCCVSFVTV